MWRGVFYILGACLCWSGVFVIPKFITGFTALEISLGRFFCFGMISTIGLLVKKRKLLTKTWGSIWKKALWLGFISTIGCYTATVLCIQYASPKVANLLFGLVPILVAIFGNHRKKEYSFRVIALPCAFIGIGIVLCNIEAFSLEGESLSSYIFGFFMGLLSLFCWVWYVLACFDFMKKNSHVTSSDWVLMTGGTVFCLATAIGGTVVGIEGLERYLALDLVSWIIGSLVLGGISSWLATYF
jgi:drug/metabolite transporter (DMT)-like permease